MPMRMAVLTAVLAVLVSCSKDKSPLEPKLVEHTLEMAVGKGVMSSPKPGIYKYPEGKSVPYTFSTESGYRNLVVEDESKSLPSSGAVLMKGDIKLFAVAEPTPVLTQESQTMSIGISKFVSAKDSASVVSAYDEHLVELKNLYIRDPLHARELALAAYLNVLEKSNQADLDRAERALSGQLISTRGVNLAVSKPPVTLIFVNGILNSVDGAAVSMKEIEKAISEAGLASKVEAYNFYNASLAHESGSLKRCLVRAIELKSYTGYLNCALPGNDVLEAKKQMGSLLGNTPNEELPKSKALAQIVDEERRSGRAVILLGHSQGTLLIQEALKTPESDKCVISISIAGPLGKSSWKEIPNGFVVAGEKVEDFILFLGYNDFDRLATNISRMADEEARKFSNTAVAYGAFNQILANLQLHLMSESYMAGVESRTKIKQIISDDVAALEKNPECSKPKGGRIYATSGRVVGGSLVGPSDLWSVSPLPSGADTKIARLKTKSGAEPIMTDLAEHPDGSLWGVSFDSLYKVDKSSGLVEGVYKFDSPMNALTIDTRGRALAASTDGTIIGLELSPLRVFFRGQFGSPYRSSGDLATSPGGVTYAVVEDDRKQSLLATVDLANGSAKPVSVNVIGSQNVWGISFVGNALYGMTSDPISGLGSLITIDILTGRETFVRKLSFNVFGASIRTP